MNSGTFLVRGVESLGNRDTTAQVHPHKLTNAMMDAAVEKGAKVLNGSVQKVVYDEGGDNQVGMRLELGPSVSVACSHFRFRTHDLEN